MARRTRSFSARVQSLAGFPAGEASAVRQALVALLLNSSTSLVAGAFLGSIQHTLAAFPGLLVLVPAAIGLRGNIFGAFGNRVSTTIHGGTFRLSTRRDTVLGQNVVATGILTLVMSAVLAIGAKGIAVALGIQHTVSVLDLSVISVIGGVLGSLVVLAATLGLAAGAVRYGWDLDNVTAPLVSTLGDVLTLPALYLATFLVGLGVLSSGLGATVLAASVIVAVIGWRSRLDLLPRILRESFPVLTIAGLISAMAGIVLEKRLDAFSAYPALLVLVPAQLSSSGALGGVLSGRLSTKIHLGVIEPRPVPPRPARGDLRLTVLLAVPVFAFNGIGAHFVSRALSHASPGLVSMAAASVLAGLAAMAFVVAIAYYGTIAAVRVGVDPDTYGIPVVSSSVDFVGAFTLVLVIVALGLT